MHPDVAALLALQEDDIAIHDVETRLAELQPRLEAMAAERNRAVSALTQAVREADSEERRRHEIAERVAQHRALHDRNEATLNSISSMREATAAAAQLEQAKRMIDEDEKELALVGQRLVEARRVVDERAGVAERLEQAQTEARDSLASDKEALERQIGELRQSRERKAREVPRNLLSRYDRIRSRKRVHAVFPLRGSSCGHCDTMIPLQRRSQMAGSGATEICEGCGVMLYATD